MPYYFHHEDNDVLCLLFQFKNDLTTMKLKAEDMEGMEDNDVLFTCFQIKTTGEPGS